jgi:predicted ABC-class ATPase
MFSKRQRARNQVTVRALALRMKEEGYDHSAEDYAKVLKAMADAGLGQLKFDRTGEVIALVNVQTTLQSVGQAVIGKAKNLQEFKQRRKFKDFEELEEGAAPAAPSTAAQFVANHQAAQGIATITLSVGGKPVTINIPTDLPADELGALIKNLTGAK